jgi:hypothetical protein
MAFGNLHKTTAMPLKNKIQTFRTRKSDKDVAKSYNRFKEFNGKAYTGMSVGRSHKWNYDQGEWRETKITPDLWGISYAVTKRRAGHAPIGSGASVGTDYHWLILAHQNVEKLNADDYSTEMTGLKFKIAHRQGGKEKWNVSAKTQRKHLIEFLSQMIEQLKQEPLPLEFEFDGHLYKGNALPIQQTAHDGIYDIYEITLNDKTLGLARRLKSGWKMELLADKKLVGFIGKAIDEGEQNS